MREILVFSGSAHPALSAEICSNLSVPLDPVRLTRFANDCLEVQLQANCRERDVFVMQNLVFLYAIVFVVLNILVDLISAWLDPRIRYG